jgi:hypothetical protein
LNDWIENPFMWEISIEERISIHLKTENRDKLGK